jgi:hypothetical protein
MLKLHAFLFRTILNNNCGENLTHQSLRRRKTKVVPSI